MINLNNVSELLELLAPDDKALIESNCSHYIVLNLHNSSSKGCFVTFSFTDHADMYDTNESRAILPLAEIARLINAERQSLEHIKLYLQLKRKMID